MRWVRARPWPIWAVAWSVFVVFAVLGAVTRGPAPAAVAARSLVDGIERGTGESVVASPTAAASPGYPGVAYPPVPVSPIPVTVPPTPTASPSAYYDSCAAAEAAGVAPLRRGRPGYRPALDRDGDGVACEADAPATSPPAPSRTPASPGPTVASPTPDPTPTVTDPPTPTPSPTDPNPPPIG
jgi:hypothetical protein